MTDFITKILQPFFDFLTFAVGKFGTKFVLAVGTEGALFYIAYYKTIADCPPWLIPLVMGIVCICYFVFRSKQELSGLAGDIPPTPPPTSPTP